MKKHLVGLALVLLATACGTEQNLNNANLGDLSETLDKAVKDTKDEGKRFNDYLIEKTNAANEKLVKANEDFNNEEHRFNQRVKDTGAKANSDVLDEEARTTGRVKDTLAKANGDAVDEEHRFNDRFKDTTKKANMDTIAEGDKLTDRIVGSDDKTTDQHGDDIRDLQRRQKLDESRLSALEKASALYSQLIAILFKTTEDEEAARKAADEAEAEARASADQGIRSDLASSVETLSSALQGLRGELEALTAALRDDLTATQQQVDEIDDRLNIVESEYQTACDVQAMISAAIAAQDDPTCTVTQNGTVSVSFTDYTDRDGSGAYCYKNSQPWITSSPNHHGQCQNNWTYVPATYHGDDGITNTIQIPNYEVSCTL